MTAASPAASKVLIARLCIEDELKRQHRRHGRLFSPLPSPFSSETKAGRTGGRTDVAQALVPVPTPHLEWVKRS